MYNTMRREGKEIDKTSSRNVGGVKVGVEVTAEIRRGTMVKERENYNKDEAQNENGFSTNERIQRSYDQICESSKKNEDRSFGHIEYASAIADCAGMYTTST